MYDLGKETSCGFSKSHLKEEYVNSTKNRYLDNVPGHKQVERLISVSLNKVKELLGG